MLGLKQSLKLSRSNGFLNMLKLMQKKTLQVYMDSSKMLSPAATAVSMSSMTGASPDTESVDQQEVAAVVTLQQPISETPLKDSIQKKLKEGLTLVQLEVEDVSYQHAGHAGAPEGSSETHFNVKVVSDSFQGRSLVKRHRLVYELLHDELQNGVHALSLITKTPTEVSSKS